jgi:hypothetical protein
MKVKTTKTPYTKTTKALLVGFLFFSAAIVHLGMNGLSLQTAHAQVSDAIIASPDQTTDVTNTAVVDTTITDTTITSATDTTLTNTQNDTTSTDTALSSTLTATNNVSQSGGSTIDVTTNAGSQGPYTLSKDESFTVDWISSNVTNCNLLMDSEQLSGVTSNGSMGPIDPSHPYYPVAGGSRTFTVTCDGLAGQVSDSVVISSAASSSPQTLSDPQLTSSTGSVCGGNIDLSWTSIVGATSYDVLQNGNKVASVVGTSYNPTGLTPGLSYSFTVIARNSTQSSPGLDQSTANASNACVVPGSSTIDITANGSQGPVVLNDGQSFTVDWISSNVTNCTLSSPNIFTSGVQSNGSTGVIDPTHLYYPAVGTSVTFNITCTGLSGSISDSVNVSRPQVVPILPIAPVISVSTSLNCGGNILISWAGVSNVTSYKVFRNGSLVSQISGTSYGDTGLTPGQSYSYTVKANNINGDSVHSNLASAVASATCNNGGGQVSTLDITANGSQGPVTLSEGQSFTVDWISSNATNCTLSSASLFTSGVQSNGSTGVIDPAHPYYPVDGGSRTFNITCTGLSGSISDSVTVIRPLAPQPPSAPVFTNISTVCTAPNATTGQITISWGGVSGATSYKVFRNGVLIATTVSTTYTDTGLNTGTLYTYTLKATNSVGDSAFSDLNSTTTPSSCAVAPTSPVVFATTGTACGGTIFVSWNAVVNTASYNVYRGGVLVATSSSLSFTDSGLTPGQSYSYTVTAVNVAGSSPSSSTASATASAQCVFPPAPPVISVTSGPECGGAISISWNSVNGANYYTIFRNGNAIATSSSISYHDTGLTPLVSYVYTVKAHGAGGDSVNSNSQTIQASAQCPLPTPTVTLTANPSTIDKGQNSTLSWSSSNTTSCIAGWTNSTNTSGSQIVSPQNTTAYSISCTNGTKTASSTATVTVVIPEERNVSVNLIANPSSISQGQNSTLSWISSNASSCTAPWTSATSTSGSQIVSPSTTMTYLITCSNSAKSATATATVTVNPVVIPHDVTVSLAANPSTITLGATSTLSWISSNTIFCSASWTTATSTSGSQTVSPNTTTTYSITCSNSTKSATATTTVTVNPGDGGGSPDVSVSLSANPSAITLGATSTLSWISSNATSCSALWTTSTSTSGSQIVSPATTTIYSINCANATKLASSTTTVTVNPVVVPDVTVSLVADPSTVTLGGSSTLSWISSNATSCAASWSTSTSTLGSQVVTPSSTTGYDISCTNGAKTATTSATVTVNVPAPTPTPPPSGGGGGGCGPQGCAPGGGGSSRRSNVPLVLGASTSCDYLHDYLHIGWNNDPVEVIKLQAFLKYLEGFDNLTVNGTFDEPTFDAVSKFQVNFQPDILTPWGYAQGESTGYVYILTKKKVNEIYCQKAFPINGAQEQEIVDFKALLESLKQHGISVGGETGNVGTPIGSVLGTTNNAPTAGDNTSTTTLQNSGGLFGSTNLRNIAAAIFTGPQGVMKMLQALVVFILVLIIVYNGGEIVINSQNKDGLLTGDAKRTRRISYGIVGFILAILAYLVFKYYVLILPTIILVVVLAGYLLWISLGKKSKSQNVWTEPINPTIPMHMPESLRNTPKTEVKTKPIEKTQSEPIINLGPASTNLENEIPVEDLVETYFEE